MTTPRIRHLRLYTAKDGRARFCEEEQQRDRGTASVQLSAF